MNTGLNFSQYTDKILVKDFFKMQFGKRYLSVFVFTFHFFLASTNKKKKEKVQSSNQKSHSLTVCRYPSRKLPLVTQTTPCQK